MEVFGFGFDFVLFWVTFSGAQALFLALCSEIAPSWAHGTIWGAWYET